jgi:hypothetical protein
MEGRLAPGALHETQRAAEAQFETKIEAKIAALEERVRSVPGKLPPAKDWCAESVIYQGEFVCYQGSTFQAIRDTATTPTLGSANWVCVARAGRDAITPKVRGTFSIKETYKQLDIVIFDGAAWIASCDNPASTIPGDGWQLFSKQGKTGQRGMMGERGPKGDKGEKGDPGPTLISWQIDRPKYRASPLWSDGRVGPNLELHGLYKQYDDETNR